MMKKFGLVLGICLLATSAVYAADCVVPFNPDGSVTLPPAGCEYQSPADIHVILDSLPDGTVVHVGATHGYFLCNAPRGAAEGKNPCTLGGGQLGGQIETSASTVKLTFSDDDGWSRTVFVSADFEVHTAQADATQKAFETQMNNLQGTAAPGDVDFAKIEIIAGSDAGFPGKGFTRITDLGGGQAKVDSFFDLGGTMRIVGTPGGRFDGVDAVFDFQTTVVAQDECDCP